MGGIDGGCIAWGIVLGSVAALCAWRVCVERQQRKIERERERMERHQLLYRLWVYREGASWPTPSALVAPVPYVQEPREEVTDVRK